MRVVKDAKGRAWEIQVDFDCVRRVKADTHIDLGLAKYPGPSGQPLMVDLYESPMQFLEVLWSVCRIRAVSEIRINQSEFEAGFFGPELDMAKDAFFEEWEGFFQKLGRAQDSETIANFRELIPRTIQQVVEQQRKELSPQSSDSGSNTPES